MVELITHVRMMKKMPPLEGDDATELWIEENWKLVQQKVYTKV